LDLQLIGNVLKIMLDLQLIWNVLKIALDLQLLGKGTVGMSQG